MKKPALPILTNRPTMIKSSTCPVLGLMINQIKLELESSQLYMALSILCTNFGYINTSKFFMSQSEEERSHAIMFMNELQKLGKSFKAPLVLNADLPDVSSINSILHSAMVHEQFISSSINKIYCTAMEHKKGMYMPFLEHMLEEQVEEEQLYRSILKWFKLCDSPADFELQILKFKTCDAHKIGTLPM